jgi:hypothetical protein
VPEFCQTPVVWEYWPVRIDAREGQQSGLTALIVGDDQDDVRRLRLGGSGKRESDKSDRGWQRAERSATHQPMWLVLTSHR